MAKLVRTGYACFSGGFLTRQLHGNAAARNSCRGQPAHRINPAIAAAALLLALPLRGGEVAAIFDDGLVPIAVKNVDKAWKRPGANLRDYTSVMIQPVSVAFNAVPVE